MYKQEEKKPKLCSIQAEVLTSTMTPREWRFGCFWVDRVYHLTKISW